MSVNRTTITGNLTRDPELRGRESNVLALGVAVNDRRKNPETDEWEDVPNFIDCVVFGRRAESLYPILKKGMKVAIDGKLRQSSWEDDTGQRRSKVEVVVDEIDIMTRREDGDRPARKGGGTRYPQTTSNPAAVPAPSGQVVAPGVYQPTLDAAQPAQPAGVYDSDIPF